MGKGESYMKVPKMVGLFINPRMHDCKRFTWSSSSITSSMVITPTTSSFDGNSGIGAFSMSNMQYEQPLCRFLNAGVAGGLFFVCWPPSLLLTSVWTSCESDLGPDFRALKPTSRSSGNAWRSVIFYFKRTRSVNLMKLYSTKKERYLWYVTIC